MHLRWIADSLERISARSTGRTLRDFGCGADRHDFESEWLSSALAQRQLDRPCVPWCAIHSNRSCGWLHCWALTLRKARPDYTAARPTVRTVRWITAVNRVRMRRQCTHSRAVNRNATATHRLTRAGLPRYRTREYNRMLHVVVLYAAP